MTCAMNRYHGSLNMVWLCPKLHWFQVISLGKGHNLSDAKDKVGQVAEGIRTLEVAHEEAGTHNINMPLMESLYKIIYQNKKPESLLDDLINHPHEIDVEFTQRGN